MKITTIRLPDGLMAQAKKVARERGTTVSALIHEGLRDVVSRKATRVPRVKAPVSSVRGDAPPAIDIANSAALQAAMDDDVVKLGGTVKLR